jgi:hypothetical protein
LTLCGCGNNFGRVVHKIVTDGPAEEFRITVAVKATSEGASCRTKQTKSREDAVGRQRFQSKSPIIAGSAIDQYKSIAITPHGNAVPICNIHVNGVKITIGGSIQGRPPFGLRNCSKRTKRHRKLAAINPFSVTANVEDVFVITKFSTAHDAVEFF